MEKSIETIWKDGFLKNDALVAPKLNNLYHKKSKHLIEKFNRMFKRNLIALVLGSTLFLIFTIFFNMLILGIGTFIICNAIVIVNKRLMNSLKTVDKNVSSFQYLKSFDNWMKDQLAVNRKMARIYYPFFFIIASVSIWFSGNFQLFISEILGKPYQIYLVNGFPILWLIPIVLIASLMAVFGDKIYNFDVNLIYGRIFRKLNDMITDIEELRK
ncbi:MAG: hypothetical protein QM495_04020 [Lutibacter sp.]|uniref:hypothetical protein n=1 Tax=Lutibacter sp. TaxID=1925666 RepID=UPI00385AD4CE